MSAFSYHEHHRPPFVTDSVFYPTSSNGLGEEHDSRSAETIPYFSEPPFSQTHRQILPSIVHATIPEAASSLEAQLQSNIANEIERLETSAEKNSTQILTFSAINNKKSRDSLSSSLTYSRDGRESGEVVKKQRKLNEEEKNSEEAPKGYIHVRARRGQATDSHSLAERVRREKISERMKLLQSLVPGCDKVTGKALMLDEIINYVQSLQNQVELACVNPMFYSLGMDVENFMFRPEQCSRSGQPNPFAETFFSAPNNYPILDTSILHPQEHIPNALSQDSGNLIWEFEDERRKLLNQPDPSAAVFNPNLYYFH